MSTVVASPSVLARIWTDVPLRWTLAAALVLAVSLIGVLFIFDVVQDHQAQRDIRFIESQHHTTWIAVLRPKDNTGTFYNYPIDLYPSMKEAGASDYPPVATIYVYWSNSDAGYTFEEYVPKRWKDFLVYASKQGVPIKRWSIPSVTTTDRIDDGLATTPADHTPQLKEIDRAVRVRLDPFTPHTMFLSSATDGLSPVILR